MADAAGGQKRVRGQNGRGVHGRERERERKVGEVQWEVSGVNEIFSSGGPERIAEIAEAEMINISRGKLPLGCFLHTDSTPSMQTHTHTPSSCSPPSSGSPKLYLHLFPGSS